MAQEGTDRLPQQTYEAAQLTCESVTVYEDRAEVKRSLKTKLQAGSCEIVVSKLAQSIDKDSIRVEGKGLATICEVQYQERHVTKSEDVQEQQKQLQGQLDQLRASRRKAEAELNRQQRKKAIIDNFALDSNDSTEKDKQKRPLISVDQSGLDNLDKFLEFYENRATKIDDQICDANESIKRIDEEIRVTQRNLHDLGGSRFDTLLREVSIILECSTETSEVELELTYLVHSARWTPSYDARVYMNDKTINMSYYGMIQQNTGEDWTNAKLFLSTAKPSVAGQIPELNTITVSLYKPPVVMEKRTSLPKARMGGRQDRMMKRGAGALFGSVNSAELSDALEEDAGSDMFGYMAAAPPPPAMAAATATVKESVACASFEIARPTTIPSDNTQHKVNVAIVSLIPKFEYETAPSRSQYAFLKALVENTSTYPFLPGPVSVFLDNDFIAKSHVKSVSPKEEFTLSLGVDPSIRVDYKPATKRREETGFISKGAVEITDQTIELKNTKQEDVKLRILEPIPLSADDKVKVELISPDETQMGKGNGGVKLRKPSNVLQWDMRLSAGQSKTVLIAYKLEYPRNEILEFHQQ